MSAAATSTTEFVDIAAGRFDPALSGLHQVTPVGGIDDGLRSLMARMEHSRFSLLWSDANPAEFGFVSRSPDGYFSCRGGTRSPSTQQPRGGRRVVVERRSPGEGLSEAVRSSRAPAPPQREGAWSEGERADYWASLSHSARELVETVQSAGVIGVVLPALDDLQAAEHLKTIGVAAARTLRDADALDYLFCFGYSDEVVERLLRGGLATPERPMVVVAAGHGDPQLTLWERSGELIARPLDSEAGESSPGDFDSSVVDVIQAAFRAGPLHPPVGFTPARHVPLSERLETAAQTAKTSERLRELSVKTDAHRKDMGAFRAEVDYRLGSLESRLLQIQDELRPPIARLDPPRVAERLPAHPKAERTAEFKVPRSRRVLGRWIPSSRTVAALIPLLVTVLVLATVALLTYTVVAGGQ